MRNTIRTVAAAIALGLALPRAVLADDTAQTPTSGEATSSSDTRIDPTFGVLASDERLADERGGAELQLNENNASAVVRDNVASNLRTGDNSISSGAFSNSNGVPMVVQNTGNNVVIQNSTILNLHLQ